MVLKLELTSKDMVVPPILEGSVRPFWSVVIPTYNCAKFLEETLESVLCQDPGVENMEIIVIDDYSTEDDPEAVVKKFGRGRVQFVRQDKNVGKSENYITGIRLSKGLHIHLLHGDDTVNNGFYRKIEDIFNTYPEAGAAFSQCNYINAKSEVKGKTDLLAESTGILDDFIFKIAVWQLIQPPSIVFKREVYETIGGYDRRLKYIEDWEFYVRCALKFEFAYIPETLANYRTFPDNSSNKSIKGGKRVATIYKVIEIIDDYLPISIKQQISEPRKKAVSVYLLNFIPKLIANRDIKGFVVVTKALMNYNHNLRLWGRWFRFILQYKKFNR